MKTCSLVNKMTNKIIQLNPHLIHDIFYYWWKIEQKIL